MTTKMETTQEQRSAMQRLLNDPPWEDMSVADVDALEAILSDANACAAANERAEKAEARVENVEAALKLADERASILRTQRDRLATDALCALSEAGISTPAEGYVAAPQCLAGDIRKLARERDEVREVLRESQLLIGRLLDVLCLPGHALARAEWERACLLGGRFTDPYLAGSRQ